MKSTSKQILNTLFIAILLSILSVNSNAQGNKTEFGSFNSVNNSDVEIPKSVERKLLKDAARLALRLTAQQKDLRYESILIPANLVERYYTVLSTIYANNPVAQSLVDCNIHTFPDPSIDRLVVIFDKTVAWAEPLQMGVNETNSDKINELIVQYDLILDKYMQWNDTQNSIIIRSKKSLNIAALATELYNVKGVTEIDFGVPDINGNDIQVNRIEGVWIARYILRFGPQITGNGKEHIWVFQLNDDGNVKLIAEEGDPLKD